MSREIGPQHDSFLAHFDYNDLLATQADINQFSADITQYSLDEYSCTDINLHCQNCVYREVCIVWQK